MLSFGICNFCHFLRNFTKISITKTIVDITRPTIFIIRAEKKIELNIFCLISSEIPNPTSSKVKTVNSSSHCHSSNLTSKLDNPA